MRFGLEEILHGFDDLWHSRHAANQNNLINIAGADPGILERGLAGLDAPLDQFVNQAFQLGAGHFHVEVLGSAGIRRDERQVDIGLGCARQFDLGLFSSFLQPLERQLVAAQVNTVILFELVSQEINNALVEILTTEESITIGGFHFENTVADFKHRHIKGTAAEVIDHDRAGFLFVETIGEGGCGRLIDNPKHFKPGDLAGILGGLTLGIVEIRRHRDHGFGYGFVEEGFGILFQFAQNKA